MLQNILSDSKDMLSSLDFGQNWTNFKSKANQRLKAEAQSCWLMVLHG